MARATLPPGVRFHPTDVELLLYYLKRKVLGKPLPFDVISEIEISKYSPWDLKGMVHMYHYNIFFLEKWAFFVAVYIVKLNIYLLLPGGQILVPLVKWGLQYVLIFVLV